MSARMEVVRTDSSWHARFVTNGRTIWTTENYTRMVGAEGAVLSFARAGTTTGWALKWNVPGVEKVFVRPDGSLPPLAPLVKYVDERTSDRSRPGLGTAGVTGAQPDEPASQAGRPVAGGAG